MKQNIIDVQVACEDALPIHEERLISWVELALKTQQKVFELTLRLVAVPEIMALNKTYRKKDKATNVLAFPSEIPEDIILDPPFLGDIVICPFVLAEEAREQNTPLEAHWAHIVLHGVLHLLGYDHIEEEDFKKMQSMEIQLLSQLGFANPYHQEDQERA